MKKSRGLTLLEMMVSLAILAIVLAVAIPSMQSWVQNQRLYNLSESLLNGIKTAQMEAVKSNMPVTFWMVSSLNADCSLYASGSPSWIVGTQANLPEGVTNPTNECSENFIQKNEGIKSDGVAISITPNNANCLAFNGFGQVFNTGATCATQITSIDLSVADTNRKIRITLTGGAIGTCNPDIASTDARGCK